MQNWKTTLVGALTGGLIAIAPILQSGHIDVQKAAVGFLIAVLGYFAKDAEPKTSAPGFIRIGGIVLMAVLSLVLLFLAVPAFADSGVTNAPAATAPGTTNDIVDAISQYVQNNANAESTIGVVMGGGVPQLGIGTFVGLYNGSIGSHQGVYQLGVKYTAVITSTDQVNLLGLGGKVKMLRLLPGSVAPPLGIIDPSLYGSVENDVNKPFMRWRFEGGVSIINVKFSSVLGL